MPLIPKKNTTNQKALPQSVIEKILKAVSEIQNKKIKQHTTDLSNAEKALQDKFNSAGVLFQQIAILWRNNHCFLGSLDDLVSILIQTKDQQQALTFAVALTGVLDVNAIAYLCKKLLIYYASRLPHIEAFLRENTTLEILIRALFRKQLRNEEGIKKYIEKNFADKFSTITQIILKDYLKHLSSHDSNTTYQKSDQAIADLESVLKEHCNMLVTHAEDMKQVPWVIKEFAKAINEAFEISKEKQDTDSKPQQVHYEDQDYSLKQIAEMGNAVFFLFLGIVIRDELQRHYDYPRDKLKSSTKGLRIETARSIFQFTDNELRKNLSELLNDKDYQQFQTAIIKQKGLSDFLTVLSKQENFQEFFDKTFHQNKIIGESLKQLLADPTISSMDGLFITFMMFSLFIEKTFANNDALAVINEAATETLNNSIADLTKILMHNQRPDFLEPKTSFRDTEKNKIRGRFFSIAKEILLGNFTPGVDGLISAEDNPLIKYFINLYRHAKEAQITSERVPHEEKLNKQSKTSVLQIIQSKVKSPKPHGRFAKNPIALYPNYLERHPDVYEKAFSDGEKWLRHLLLETLKKYAIKSAEEIEEFCNIASALLFEAVTINDLELFNEILDICRKTGSPIKSSPIKHDNVAFTSLEIQFAERTKPENLLKREHEEFDIVYFAVYKKIDLKFFYQICELVNGLDAFSFTSTQRKATPLFLAAYLNLPEHIKILLKAGADPNSINREDQFTPLMIAVVNQNIEAVKKLLKSSKTDLLAKNNRGETALDLAMEIDAQAIIQLLEQAQTRKPVHSSSSESLPTMPKSPSHVRLSETRKGVSTDSLSTGSQSTDSLPSTGSSPSGFSAIFHKTVETQLFKIWKNEQENIDQIRKLCQEDCSAIQNWFVAQLQVASSSVQNPQRLLEMIMITHTYLITNDQEKFLTVFSEEISTTLNKLILPNPFFISEQEKNDFLAKLNTSLVHLTKSYPHSKIQFSL